MDFKNCDTKLTEGEIGQIELALGLKFPSDLRAHYLRWNGGCPEPYVYEDDNVYTAVQLVLPLHSKNAEPTAVDTYNRLVVVQGIVAPSFFPFAIDPGGDYFFVDCSSAEGWVHLYRHDSLDPGLIDLGIGFVKFWETLKPEE